MSLLGSIFGESATHPGEVEPADGSLSNLFDRSSTLPEKPHHTPLPPDKNKRKTIPAEPQEPKKKRKPPKEQTEQEEEHCSRTPEEEAKDNVDERTIFVGNLPLTITRKSLANIFKSCGNVESSRLRSVAAAGVKLPTERAGDQVRQTCYGRMPFYLLDDSHNLFCCKRTW
jgi:RNA recognition motif. (a.k.a. RRM, RBD, or RNP domain)